MLQQEQKIVEEAKKDPEKFVDLYNRYFDQIYRYVSRRINDQDIVQDIVSQTFYDALAHLQSFQWRGHPFSSWLYKIAHNNVLKWYRSSQKLKVVDIEEAGALKDEKVDQMEDIIRSENQSEVRNAIEHLSQEDQELIRLKYFEELGNNEIAEVMGISPNNVGVKIYRTLHKLKQLLKN